MDWALEIAMPLGRHSVVETLAVLGAVALATGNVVQAGMVVAEAISTTKIAAAAVALVIFELVLRCLRASLWQAEGAEVEL
jgi:hypothetical protein